MADAERPDVPAEEPETVETPTCPFCGSYKLGYALDPCTECGHSAGGPAKP